MLAVLFYLLLFTVAKAASHDGLEDSGFDLSSTLNGFTFKQARRISAPKPDKPSSRFSRLRHIKGAAGHNSALSVLGNFARSKPSTNNEPYQNITAVGGFSTQYAIQCAWDGVPIWLLFDTGSSDTWAAGADFECRGSSGEVNSQGACGFGKPLIEGFKGSENEALHFFLEYGSGEQVTGPMGYSDISCGGLTVYEQQVGLANDTHWYGNNITSGILGLAYPAITSAYYGNLGDEAPWNAITYPPFLTTAISQGSIDAVFSVAIVRNSTDGVLAWGGLPPIAYDRSTFAATDLIIANLINSEETAWRYSFYTIIPDGLRWGQTVDATKYPYIVDTGTTMMYFPPPVAETIARAFEPAAIYLYQWEGYFVDCAAIPPQLAIIIDGVDFRVNAADLIFKDLVDPLTGYCAIGIASGGSGPYILGDVFMQNVVAVFDVGAAQMRFYAQ